MRAPRGRRDSVGVTPEEDRIRDKYARRKNREGRYSWFNPAFVFMIQERERCVLKLLKREGILSLKDHRILEIGCGTGLWLQEFIKWGARPENIAGIELLAERAEQARRLCPEGVTVLSGSAVHLDFADGTFDVVLQSTVFTSMQDSDLRRQVAAEMIRVVRKSGFILWYDFRVNNPQNPDVTGVGKPEISELFRGCHVRLYPVTLAPPITRRLVHWSWLGCYLLGRTPGLRTHYLGIIRKI